MWVVGDGLHSTKCAVWSNPRRTPFCWTPRRTFWHRCGTIRRFVVLAQSRGAADDFVRAACRTGLLGVHRMTLTGLAVDLAEGPLARAGTGARSGGLSAEAMVARVIHKLKAESIPYFQPVADTPGLARAVARHDRRVAPGRRAAGASGGDRAAGPRSRAHGGALRRGTGEPVGGRLRAAVAVCHRGGARGEAPVAGAAGGAAGCGPGVRRCGGSWPRRCSNASPAVFDAR